MALKMESQEGGRGDVVRLDWRDVGSACEAMSAYGLNLGYVLLSGRILETAKRRPTLISKGRRDSRGFEGGIGFGTKGNKATATVKVTIDTAAQRRSIGLIRRQDNLTRRLLLSSP